MKHEFVITDYSYPVYTDMEAVERNAERIAKALRSWWTSDEIFTLVCRGTSGILIAAAIRKYMNSLYNYDPCIYYVRKDSEARHHEVPVPYNSTLVIVDDFVSSGATMTKIFDDLGVAAENVKAVAAGMNYKKSKAILEQFPNVDLIITEAYYAEIFAHEIAKEVATQMFLTN